MKITIEIEMDDFELSKGVRLIAQQLLEEIKETEENTGFHEGDIVEVVAKEWHYSGNPLGLQGVVVKSIETGATVQLLTYDEPLYFFNHELKLIRR